MKMKKQTLAMCGFCAYAWMLRCEVWAAPAKSGFSSRSVANSNLRLAIRRSTHVLLEGEGGVWEKETGLGFLTGIDVKGKQLKRALASSLQFTGIHSKWDGNEGDKFIRVYCSIGKENPEVPTVEVVYRNHKVYACTTLIKRTGQGEANVQNSMILLSSKSSRLFAKFIRLVSARAQRDDSSAQYVEFGGS